MRYVVLFAKYVDLRLIDADAEDCGRLRDTRSNFRLAWVAYWREQLLKWYCVTLARTRWYRHRCPGSLLEFMHLLENA